MPCLSADALTQDPEGLAFLRAVLAGPAHAASARGPVPAERERIAVLVRPAPQPSTATPALLFKRAV